jgi:oligosaccharide repeat unit polymerase
MSEIYSITTKFFRMVKTNIKRSLLFTTIFRIGLFFERQWINSFFVKFYPNENFLSIIKKSKIISNSLFHPIIVIFAFSIFLILSLSPISTDLQINIAIGFITFVIGSTIIPKYFFNKKHEFINFKQDDVYSIGFCLFLVGIVFFFLSIASVGGIPLLKPSLRYSLKPILTMPVFLMIPGIAFIASSYLQDFKKKKINRSQIRFRFIVLIAISGFFLFALGYRTPTIAILLIMIIMGYYGKVLSIWEIVIGILLGIAMIIGIGYFRSLEEFMITKNTSPLYSLQSRADFTLHVLNLLNYISGDFGTLHGTLTLSSIPGSETGPRMLVGQLIAW